MSQGAKNSFLNGNYTKSTNANGRAVYFHEDGEIGLWFNGKLDQPGWRIGGISDFDQGSFNAGYLYVHDDTDCPYLATGWQEWEWVGEWVWNEEEWEWEWITEWRLSENQDLLIKPT